jgi:hypothetical protein
LSVDIKEEIKRGKGTWCFNSDLTKDIAFKRLINKTLDEIEEIKEKTQDINEFWTVFKGLVKIETIDYCRKKKEKSEEPYKKNWITKLKFWKVNLNYLKQTRKT